MHAKSDSEVTSLAPSSPTRSPRRPLYYVQSPSQHDAEKMSFQSSPMASPSHHHFQYHCSPIHHSRESSTTRFSASIKNPKTGAWKKMLHETGEEDDEDDDDDGLERHSRMSLPKFYFICFILSFVVLFTAFSLILWGASKPYKPRVSMQVCGFSFPYVDSGRNLTVSALFSRSFVPSPENVLEQLSPPITKKIGPMHEPIFGRYSFRNCILSESTR